MSPAASDETVGTMDPSIHVVLLVIFTAILFTKDLRERRCYARKVSIMPAAGFGITRLFTNSPS
jgi:hypothetical protein